MTYPDPSHLHPMPDFPQVCFLKNIVNNSNIIVGDYTYYDDPAGAKNFDRQVLYHYSFVGDKLIIGQFCAIAEGVKFIMNGANHSLSGFSTYPFEVFGGDWQIDRDYPYKGDTVIGNDVWLGYQAVILPGSTLAMERSLELRQWLPKVYRPMWSSAVTQRGLSVTDLMNR